MLGSTIKRLREKQGLTQEQLAKKARITQAYVASLETGVRPNPSLPVLRKLAKALKVQPAKLIE